MAATDRRTPGAVAQIAAMTRKDLVRRLRAPVWLIVSLLFPLTFAGMLGLAFEM